MRCICLFYFRLEEEGGRWGKALKGKVHRRISDHPQKKIESNFPGRASIAVFFCFFFFHLAFVTYLGQSTAQRGSKLNRQPICHSSLVVCSLAAIWPTRSAREGDRRRPDNGKGRWWRSPCPICSPWPHAHRGLAGKQEPEWASLDLVMASRPSDTYKRSSELYLRVQLPNVL